MPDAIVRPYGTLDIASPRPYRIEAGGVPGK
jgi:hypothetical protein